MSRPLVSIIIVNWNGGEIFENCLTSLRKIMYPNWELIIVDNGSTQKPPKSKYYKLVINPTNMGFAGGNNKGLEKARGKYVLLLNNDTTVKPDFLDKMVNKMEKRQINRRHATKNSHYG